MFFSRFYSEIASWDRTVHRNEPDLLSTDKDFVASKNKQNDGPATEEGEGDHQLDYGELEVITDTVKCCTLFASLNSCMVGYDQGVSTHISRLIQSEFGLSDWERGLYIAFLFLFMVLGALYSPYISDRVGRRAALARSSYVFLAGTLVMTCSPSFDGILVGRAICGVGAGLGFMVDAMYIAELSPETYRGEMVTWSYMALTIGFMLGISAGSILSFLAEETKWRAMLGIGMTLPIALIMACHRVLVESPRFLVLAKRNKEARDALTELYPEGYCVIAVLEEIRQALLREKQSQEVIGWSTFCHPSPAFRRIFYLGRVISFAQAVAGAEALEYYILDIMEDSEVQPAAMRSLALIGLQIIKLQCIFICSQLLDRFGRKMMLFVSLAGLTVSLLAVGISFLFSGFVEPVIALFGLGAYMAFYGIGLGPASRLIPVEIFPTCVRAKALAVAVITSRGTAAVLAATLLTLKEAISWPHVFFGLSGLCIINGTLLFCFLPETKNLTLEEMSLQFAEITHDLDLLTAERKLRGAEVVPGFDGGSSRSSKQMSSDPTILRAYMNCLQ